MTDVVIRAEGLGKRYRLGERVAESTLRDALTSAVRAPVRLASRLFSKPVESEAARTFWALRDVSFEVERGQVLAVIGRNGAGKSTLLKLLSRIVEPTEGKATLLGRVGSLLEVGTGFHPELTGRENIFLNGAILGMKRHEIERKFDEIVAFAEVERFLDTPVKHYSSGMGLRLGFAVAAHLEPEVLVIDEVLAVGDAAFQRKCLGKMGDVAKQGRTVLFVSHNMAAVRSLCTRALVLENGRAMFAGPVNEAVDRYLGAGAETQSERIWDDPATAPGNERARLRAVRAVLPDGKPAEHVSLASPFVIEVEYEVLVPDTVLHLALLFRTPENVDAFLSRNKTDDAWYARPHPVGRYRSRCQVPRHLFNEGRYSLTLRLVERAKYLIGLADGALALDFIDLDDHLGAFYGSAGKWPGVVRPLLEWQTERERGPEPQTSESRRASSLA